MSAPRLGAIAGLGALVGSVMGKADAATRIAALRMADPILRGAF